MTGLGSPSSSHSHLPGKLGRRPGSNQYGINLRNMQEFDNEKLVHPGYQTHNMVEGGKHKVWMVYVFNG
jgi:hypothetical protein